MSKTDQPLVSIIIPAYNAVQYLAETITSALNQTWLNTEIIIINDGSIDNTLNIAKSFEKAGVHVIDQINKGAAAARNAGLAIAKGSYIQFLDADDLLSPDKIESQVNCLHGSSTHLAISKTVHFFDDDDHLNSKIADSWVYADNDDPLDFIIKLYSGNEIMPGYGGMVTVHSWLMPRILLDKVGPWNEELSIDDDGEFFCQAILACKGIKFSVNGVNYYRKYAVKKSLSGQITRQSFRSRRLAIDLKYEYLKLKTQDKIIDRIFARHYWGLGVDAYPQFTDISNRAIYDAKRLGYRGPKYVSGKISTFLSKLLGWRLLRVLSYARHGS
jgi:glycosyltransferase involved in cell wall biosynthesis